MRTQMDVDTLRGLLARGEPVTVLDIRPAEEWAEWAIAGSVNADVYDALQAKNPDAMAGIELPANRPVVTV